MRQIRVSIIITILVALATVLAVGKTHVASFASPEPGVVAGFDYPEPVKSTLLYGAQQPPGSH